MKENIKFLCQQQMLCPQQNPIMISNKLSSMKMQYLMSIKQDLEMELIELRQNNRMLRRINTQLSVDEPYDVMILVERNKQLENVIYGLGEKNRKLKTDIFLSEQVSIQNDRQQRQINKTYESKILELRRLIQGKQVSIQELERKLKNGNGGDYEIFVDKKNMEYFDFICESQNRLRELGRENSMKMKQIERLKDQNMKWGEKVMRLEYLVRSKCSFLEYRNILNDGRSKSNPKGSVLYGFKLKIDKNQASLSPTNNTTKNMSFFSDDSNVSQYNWLQKCDNNLLIKARQIIENKMRQNQKIRQKNRRLQRQKQEYKIELKNFKDSNIFYKKEYKRMNQIVESYKMGSVRLYEYLTRRKSSQFLLENNEFQGYKIGLNKIVNRMNVQKKNEFKFTISQQKSEWINASKILNKKLLQASFARRKRSNSCVIDYIFEKDRDQKNDDQMKNQKQISFDENNGSILLNECGLQNMGFVTVSGSKKKIGKKVESSFNIFDDVLQNL